MLFPVRSVITRLISQKLMLSYKYHLTLVRDGKKLSVWDVFSGQRYCWLQSPGWLLLTTICLEQDRGGEFGCFQGRSGTHARPWSNAVSCSCRCVEGHRRDWGEDDELQASLICLLHSQWFLLIWHQWDSVWYSDSVTDHSNFTVYQWGN